MDAFVVVLTTGCLGLLVFFQHVLMSGVWRHALQSISLESRIVSVAKFDFCVWMSGSVWLHGFVDLRR